MGHGCCTQDKNAGRCPSLLMWWTLWKVHSRLPIWEPTGSFRIFLTWGIREVTAQCFLEAGGQIIAALAIPSEHLLPRWLSDKESACQCKRRWRPEFDAWVRKIPWSRKWQPTPVFLLGESHGKRSLAGYSPWGHKRVRHDWVTYMGSVSVSVSVS